MASVSIESSDAHVLDAARTTSTAPLPSRWSASGTVWSATRGPTAARHATSEIGEAFGAKRSSPPRTRMASMLSGRSNRCLRATGRQ